MLFQFVNTSKKRAVKLTTFDFGKFDLCKTVLGNRYLSEERNLHGAFRHIARSVLNFMAVDSALLYAV